MVFSPTRSAVEAVGQTFTLRRSEPENMPPMISRLGRRDVVLLGIGHTNAHVLRMWRMQPIPDAQLKDGPYFHPGPDSDEVRYLRERRAALEANPTRVQEVLRSGEEKARAVAKATMDEVHQVMKLG